MKIVSKQNSRSSKSGAFTLIEMIGVLAVIAILAALLIPKVFEAINNARSNNAAVSCNTVKTALTDHYAKYGTIMSSNGTAITVTDAGATNFDKTLLSEGFLDKPFVVKIGDGTGNHVEAVASLSAATAVTAANAAYDPDGSGAAVNDTAIPASVVVQAVITGVSESEAKDLNDRLDGTLLGSPLGVADIMGRVKYATPVSGLTTVYIYITHR